MSSKSAKIVVVLVVAVIAFCFAGVCSSLTGEISLGLNESNNTFNLTNNSSPSNTPVEDNSYSESSYDTSSSDDSSQDVYYEESTDNGHQHQGGESGGNQEQEPGHSGEGGESSGEGTSSE